MGHEDEGDAEAPLQELQLVLNLLAQIGVERAERLVEQQNVRLDHERASERDALLLPAGQPVGAHVADFCQPERIENALDLRVAFGLWASF